MMNHKITGEEVSPLTSVFACLSLGISCVLSLYIWSSEHNRDHPSIVKRRFLSVFFIMLISPTIIYIFSAKEVLENHNFAELLGLKADGCLLAALVPIGLTGVLFLGPLCVQILNYQGTPNFLSGKYWKEHLRNILWWRNHVVAPLTEEFTFRACMLPLMMQSFKPISATMITPLFFGVAHFHHIIERLREGKELKNVLLVSCFQFAYTTIFGFYSSYLFGRTGHFLAPFVAHVFCNYMGFPDILEIIKQNGMKKILYICLYLIGLFSWIYLMPMLTNPNWYNNNLYNWDR
ncbi:CAAX prenyl protease 2 [Condylostylus longicornis]|uniref:CAAX prenyl protease 2 n=1 Tax=Condylostylus longicornis TaxID=2530218 RepID=UPI00244DC066|nr:CAAX prenyl protease 2 [Condylostylus longicornis]